MVERKVSEMRAFQGITGLGFEVSGALNVTIFVSAFLRASEASNRRIEEDQ